MPNRPFGRIAAASAFLFSVAHAGAARAEAAPTDAQIRAARDLFIAAEKDEDAQHWGDALEKLQRVAAVKLTSGVRYHTALCEEHLGRLTAALRDYKAAASQARSENAADVLRLVDKRVVDATDRQPHVVVVLVPDAFDATVWLDGEPIAPGTPVAVDPGSHAIEARATGRAPSSTTVTVQERESPSVQVKLDPLVTAPPPAPAPAASPPPEAASSVEGTRSSAPGHRAVAIVAVVGAVGLAAGGVGAYLAATSAHSDAIAACAQVVTAETDACDSRRNTVRTWDWVALGAWAGALGAGALATVSFIRLRHDTAPSAAHLVVGPSTIGLGGTF